MGMEALLFLDVMDPLETYADPLKIVWNLENISLKNAQL
jgi:hypothetical protein